MRRLSTATATTGVHISKETFSTKPPTRVIFKMNNNNNNNNNNHAVTSEDIANLIRSTSDQIRFEQRVHLVLMGCFCIFLACLASNRLKEIETMLKVHVGMSWIEAHNMSQFFLNNGFSVIEDA